MRADQMSKDPDAPAPGVTDARLITHRFALGDSVEAYDLFSNRRDGVLKVAIRP